MLRPDDNLLLRTAECLAPSDQNMVDLSKNPWSTGDTTDGVMALINEGNANPNGGQPTGQDFFNLAATPYGNPAAFPFQISRGL
jgi:hypothetical protein